MGHGCLGVHMEEGGRWVSGESGSIYSFFFMRGRERKRVVSGLRWIWRFWVDVLWVCRNWLQRLLDDERRVGDVWGHEV